MASFTLSSSLTARMAALSFSSSVTSVDRLKASRAPTISKIDTTTEARVAIRFTRMGRKHAPFYRIVAISSYRQRDGLPLEYLGWHNPMKNETKLKAPLIKKWLDCGAQPSEAVQKLLTEAMIIDQWPPEKKKKLTGRNRKGTKVRAHIPGPKAWKKGETWNAKNKKWVPSAKAAVAVAV